MTLPKFRAGVRAGVTDGLRCSPSTTSAPRSRTSCACSRPRRPSREVDAARLGGRGAGRARRGGRSTRCSSTCACPGLDGLELARVLRRFDRPPAVVFVSASTTSPCEAFELEALDYLVKPVSRQRLDEALDRVGRAPPRRPAAAPRTRRCAVDAPRRRHAPARALARSSSCRPTATTCACQRRRALPAARARWRTSRSAGRATASCASTAPSSSTCAAPSRCARGSTAPPCCVMADGTEVPIARRQVGRAAAAAGGVSAPHARATSCAEADRRTAGSTCAG